MAKQEGDAHGRRVWRVVIHGCRPTARAGAWEVEAVGLASSVQAAQNANNNSSMQKQQHAGIEGELS